MTAVVARGLRKSYGSLVAVDGVDLEVPRGVCYGFLGPNGAGKTTTMRMVYCASPVGGGSLEVLGHDATDPRAHRAIKRRIGVVPQDDNLDQDLSLRENLALFARFYGLGAAAAEARAVELLAQVGLTEKADARVMALSGGMKRRALIARGLLGDPKLLVLDEPTTGLDPQARQQLWSLVSGLRRRNVTVLLTTHYMDEAERLCDELVVMDKGRVVARGAPAALVAALGARAVVEVWLEGDEELAALDPLRARVLASEHLEDRLLFRDGDGDRLLAEVTAALPGRRSLIRRANLEDVFLALTGRTLG